MAEQESKEKERTDEATAEEATAEEATAEEEADADETTAEAGDGSVREGAGVVAAQAARPEEILEAGEAERNQRKERVGVVVSDKMEKTIVVSIERQKKHPMYQKYLKRSSRMMVHDEEDEAGEGDTVRIVETRPISKHKRWRLVEVIKRAE